MKRIWQRSLAAAAIALTPAVGGAQSAVSSQTGTALAVFGGAASGDGNTDGAAGATVSWELTPYFTLEGSGIWTTGSRLDAFSALAGTRVHLLPRRTVVPFASAGVGLYRATLAGQATAPAFYRRRLEARGTAGPNAGRTFDDLVFAIGGGADVYLKRHLALRPDIRVLLVHADTGTRAVPVYGVHLAYHFEEHRVTP